MKRLQLSSKKLILDVPTKLNGTYLMLHGALQFKEVFLRYGDRDQSFEWVPSTKEWQKVESVCQLLVIFNVQGSDCQLLSFWPCTRKER